MRCARCAQTTSRRADHSNPDRTEAGRPATERTPMARTGAVLRPVDVRCPLHRVESTGREWTPSCSPPTPLGGVHREQRPSSTGVGSRIHPVRFSLTSAQDPVGQFRFGQGGRLAGSTCLRSGAGTGDQSWVPVSVRWSSASWIRASTAAWRFSSTPSRWVSSGLAAL